MRSIFIVTLLLLVTYPEVNAQQFRRIWGTITSSETLEPLSFAGIKLKNGRKGIISNENGEFFFRIPSNALSDTLIFSYLGYEPVLVAITDMSSDTLEIVLYPHLYQLQEVTKQFLSPTSLLRQSLAKIPENYPDTIMGMTAFYRENIKENGQPIQMIEAVIGIQKSSYSNSKKRDRMMILKGHQSSRIRPSRLWSYVNFVDGPYESLESDVCKYPSGFITLPKTRFNFLNPRHFKHFEYHLLDDPDSMNSDYYVVRFIPLSGRRRGALEGEIFIDKNSLAIVRMDYRINPYHVLRTSVIDYNTKEELDNLGIYTQTKSFECSIHYFPYKGKWYFNNVYINYQFHLLWLDDSYLAEINNTINFVVTDFGKELVHPIKAGNQIRRRFPLTVQLGIPDEAFWENYNFIIKEK